MKANLRVLIYGGRDFVGTRKHLDFLSEHVPNPTDRGITVVSGCARGADTFGETWATMWEYPVDRFPADWKRHGKRAGFIRNQEMLDSGISLAIEFPGGNGTRDMRARLDAANIEVIEYVVANV